MYNNWTDCYEYRDGELQELYLDVRQSAGFSD
jgi:hypothetical protein